MAGERAVHWCAPGESSSSLARDCGRGTPRWPCRQSRVWIGAIVSVGFALINLVESLAAALLVRRVTPDAIRLRHPADVISLSALCGAVATGGAILAATLAWAALDAHFWTALRTWIAADISGMVTIGPVVLAIVRRTDTASPWTPRRVAEGALMLMVVGAASWWIFFSPHTAIQTPLTQPFPLLALAIWAAVRFGVPGTIWSLLIINSLCLWGTSLGCGPYATGLALQAHMTVQLFSCAVSLLFLVLATSVESTQRSVRLHRELALQVQSAADAERSRLAHELHDDIAQKLAALKMQLELDRLKTQKGRSTDEFVGAVDHLIADVRALSRSMRPAPFEEGHLIPALATLARTEGRRAGLRVSWTRASTRCACHATSSWPVTASFAKRSPTSSSTQGRIISRCWRSRRPESSPCASWTMVLASMSCRRRARPRSTDIWD